MELTYFFLSSSIIENIINLHETDASIAYAYFFFDGRDSQTGLQLHDKLIRSLIRQFSGRCGGIPATLVELYGHGDQQPSNTSLQDTLHCILDGLPTAYIIIDSLDECTERSRVLKWLDEIVSRKMNNLHMAVASRPERDISDVFRALDLQCVDIAEEASNHDVATYIEQELAAVRKWDDETREIIKSTLMMRSQGMYAFCCFEPQIVV